MTEERSALAVLESLTAYPDLPQRGIAARTGLNLAKVNFVLQRLVDRGYVQLRRIRENPHKLRYLYLLTAEGMAEKTRLAYRFLQRTVKEYGAAEQRVSDSIESMVARGIRRVVLWGNNDIAVLCQRLMGRIGGGISVVGVVDASGSHPQALHPSQVPNLDLDGIIVCDAEAKDIPADLPVWRLI